MRNNRNILKNLCCIGVLIMLAVVLTSCNNQIENSSNYTEYNSRKYVHLEYPEDIFYYDYNGNSHDNFAEVDGKYPIDSPKWNMIWNAGDLYCIEDNAEEAIGYYADDDNYVWYAVIDTDEEDDEINSYPISVTAAELEYIYAIENQKRELAVYFEDFKKLGSIFKISEDGVVRGTISIGKYEDSWYWRSEVVDDSRERDGTWPEYIQPLPNSLSNKIMEIE